MTHLRLGKFISLEGVDGAGKSTHLDWLSWRLRKAGYTVIVTREPGGTAVGEKVRELALHEPMGIHAETLMMFAARREHLEQVIWPALKRGDWVLSDRFTDATYAYQGAGRGLELRDIEALENWVHPGFRPDLTFVFHLSVEIAEKRRSIRGGAGSDKFEQLEREFFRRVGDYYLSLGKLQPSRVQIIDASRTIDEIRLDLEETIVRFCGAS